LTMLAPKLARAVDSMLKRETVFAMNAFLHGERAERVSLRPHWRRKGSACIERAVSPVSLRLWTRRSA